MSFIEALFFLDAKRVESRLGISQCETGCHVLMRGALLTGDTSLEDTLWNGRRIYHRKAFVEGFLTNALNPKVSMFYLAAFPQFIPAVDPMGSAFLLISIHVAMNFMWFSMMVVLFSSLSGAAKNVTFQKWLKATTGVVFIGFGAKLATLRA